MKKTMFVFIFSFCSHFLFSQITRESAINIVKNQLNSLGKSNYMLYTNPVMVNSNTGVLLLGNGTQSLVNFSSWCLFVDYTPLESWSHPCEYICVDVQNGSITTIQSTLPPLNLGQWEVLTTFPTVPDGAKFDFSKNLKILNQNTATHGYAVIISGGANKENNWIRYWNDCSAIYSTLTKVYGYSDDHIYVLISDGTNSGIDRRKNDNTYDNSPLDLDGDGDNDIRYAATKSNISNVFNILAGKLTSSDFLFIYTTDHGGKESGSDVYMNLWNNEKIRDDEFAIEVNKVNAAPVSIVMEQCHSGGFVDDLSKQNVIIATACRYDQSSFAMPTSYTYNEFVYHWTSAVTGKTPNGTSVNADYNGDSYVSMQEAFTYAKAKDTRNEIPQYGSVPNYFGAGFSLNGIETNANCSGNLNIENIIYNNGILIKDCNITLKNVTIQNNSNVIIDAGNTTTINGPFEVQVGSTLEIR